jgi:anti-sigma factor RsiW
MVGQVRVSEPGYRLAPPMSQSDEPTEQVHLRLEEIVSYIDQTLADGIRRQVESHLVECEACLREVIEVRQLLRGAV